MSIFFSFGLLLLGGFMVVLAQDQGQKVTWAGRNSDICLINTVRTALVNDAIYLMDTRLQEPGIPDFTEDSSLVKVSLRSPSDVSSLLLKGNLQTSVRPSNFPSSNSGAAFWHDATSLYAVSGNDAQDQSNIWTYNTTSETWKNVAFPSGQTLPKGSRNSSSFVSAPQLPLSFSTGANADSPFLKLNTTAGSDLSLVNPPSSSASEDAQPTRDNAELFYVPVGKQGVLVSFGGGDPNVPRTNSFMENFDLYDVESQQWLPGGVKASGNAFPDSLRAFCGWVTAASDFSSYSITIYGGVTTRKREATNEIWVLSMPSFQWFKMPTGNSSENGRYHHSCLSYKQDRGFVLGGFITDSTGKVTTIETDREQVDVCGTSQQTLRLLNLSTFQWENAFDPAKDDVYQVPSAVTKVIGGSASGGATLTPPDKTIQSLFAQRATPPPPPPPPPPPAPAPDAPSENPTPADPSNPNSPANPSNFSATSAPDPDSVAQNSDAQSDTPSVPRTAIIASSVSGGVLLLSCIGAFFLICTRRRRQRQRAAAPTISFPSKSSRSGSPEFWDQTPAMGYRGVAIAPDRPIRVGEGAFTPGLGLPMGQAGGLGLAAGGGGAATPGARFVSLHAASEPGRGLAHDGMVDVDLAAQMPSYEQGASSGRIYTRDELDSPGSSYSPPLHHGEDQRLGGGVYGGNQAQGGYGLGVGVGRSGSDVSSLDDGRRRNMI